MPGLPGREKRAFGVRITAELRLNDIAWELGDLARAPLSLGEGSGTPVRGRGEGALLGQVQLAGRLLGDRVVLLATVAVVMLGDRGFGWCGVGTWSCWFWLCEEDIGGAFGAAACAHPPPASGFGAFA